MAFELQLPSEEDTTIKIKFPKGDELVVDALDLDLIATQASEQAGADHFKYYDIAKNIFLEKYGRSIGKFALHELMTAKNEMLNELKKNPSPSPVSTESSGEPQLTPDLSDFLNSASPSSMPKTKSEPEQLLPDSPPPEAINLL